MLTNHFKIPQTIVHFGLMSSEAQTTYKSALLNINNSIFNAIDNINANLTSLDNQRSNSNEHHFWLIIVNGIIFIVSGINGTYLIIRIVRNNVFVSNINIPDMNIQNMNQSQILNSNNNENAIQNSQFQNSTIKQTTSIIKDDKQQQQSQIQQQQPQIQQQQSQIQQQQKFISYAELAKKISMQKDQNKDLQLKASQVNNQESQILLQQKENNEEISPDFINNENNTIYYVLAVIMWLLFLVSAALETFSIIGYINSRENGDFFDNINNIETQIEAISTITKTKENSETLLGDYLQYITHIIQAIYVGLNFHDLNNLIFNILDKAKNRDQQDILNQAYQYLILFNLQNGFILNLIKNIYKAANNKTLIDNYLAIDIIDSRFNDNSWKTISTNLINLLSTNKFNDNTFMITNGNLFVEDNLFFKTYNTINSINQILLDGKDKFEAAKYSFSNMINSTSQEDFNTAINSANNT